MGLNEVSSVLWRERELLELLLFKLEEEQLLLAHGRPRWLARATNEVEMVLAEIRATELQRATEVEGVARELGLPANPSLSKLADSAPSPWREILHEHRKAFLETTAEITSLAQSNRELLTAGYRAAREALTSIGEGPGPVAAYTPTGARETARLRPRMLDEAI